MHLRTPFSSFVLLLQSVTAFLVNDRRSMTTQKTTFGVRCNLKHRTSTTLFFRNSTAPNDEVIIIPRSIFDSTNITSRDAQLRNRLKKELAVAAIENYDVGAYNTSMTAIAEDIMKQLEPLRLCDRPAYHPDLNARWLFVFTGVPTIGMQLITILSRLSVGLSPVEFETVFLEVAKQQTTVKSVVLFRVLGIPFELTVHTSLRPNYSYTTGTHLTEQFEGIYLQGMEIPTPKAWHGVRDLEITYLDADMMIARTAGGEPHLLLRHSPCSTDAVQDECDIDNTETEYFQEAKQKYGETLARSLVDRAYGEQDESKAASMFELIYSICSSNWNRGH